MFSFNRKNYTDNMYITAIRNYYTDNVKDYRVAAINIQSRENGIVTAQVYLLDANNNKITSCPAYDGKGYGANLLGTIEADKTLNEKIRRLNNNMKILLLQM